MLDPHPLLHAPALAQHGPIFDLHVEEVDLLVALRYRAVGVDPDQGVLHFCFPVHTGGGARFVDADVDGEAVVTGGFLQAEDEG